MGDGERLMLRPSILLVVGFTCIAAWAGCEDSAPETEDDAGGATNVGGGVTSSMSNTTPSTGGNPASGGSGGTAGAGGTNGAGGGGGSGCPDLGIGDGMPAECDVAGTRGSTLSDTTICPSDSSVFWPAVVYEVTVAAGDCLFMQADNVGSTLGADLFGAIVDPGGKSILWDEEQPCSVANPDGYACPAGGATMEAAGTAYVMVGAWEGAGCTPTEAVPFELDVALNGTDVDLSGAFVCAGDLLEIIP